MHHQKGLSLVELIIAIALSLFLMAGVIQLFLGSKITFTTQQSMSRVQETGRLAIDFIAQDVRMAGFTGFRGRGVTITNTVTPINAFNNYQEGISVLSAAPTGISALAGTDILIIRGVLSGVSATVSGDVASGLITVPAVNVKAGACSGGSDQVSGMCIEDDLVIADYLKARVFKPSSLTVSGANLRIGYTGGWGGDIINPNEFFTHGAQVSPMRTAIYFIGTGVSGQPGLFQNIDGNSLELLEGVRNMSISYSRASAPNTYVAAAGAIGALWNNDSNPLVSIRIELLVQSPNDNALESPQSYTFAGATVTAGDRRMYQVFTTTIALRNQLP